jgi:outer membrane protein
MLKKKLIVCLFCLTGFVICGSAQEAWTYGECIRYAYDNNIKLKQQQLNVEKSENDLLQSKLAILPSLNASGSYSSSKGKVLDQSTFTMVDDKTVNSFNTDVSSSVSLFKGLQQKNTISRNLYSLLADMENVEKSKNDLSINIALAYLQIVHAQEQLTVAENQFDLSILQVNRTATLVDAGFEPEGKLFDIQSQAASDELQVVTARNTLDISRLNLAQMLDLETSANFQVVIPDFSNFDISDLLASVDDVYAIAETILPEVKAAGYNLKSAEKQLAFTKGYRSPTLSLSGGYSSRASNTAGFKPGTDPADEIIYPVWDQLRDNINSYISIRLSIPIFNGWQLQTGVKNAKLNVQNYQYNLQLTKNILYKEIQQAYADAAASLKKYIASTKTVTSMEEAFRYNEQRYEVGLMNFVDYSTAKTRLTAAQSDMLQAKFDYIFKTKVLDFYNGREITL